MNEDKIIETANKYVLDRIDKSYKSYSEHRQLSASTFSGEDVSESFVAGAKFALSNQWQKIERDKDGFAIDTTLGKVLIMDDSEEVYINDDDDYIHNTHCVYWMPIPNLPKELK